jgi:hypothetical protein
MGLALLLTGVVPGAQASQPALDVTKPMTVNLEMCESASELDCIESFSLVSPTSSNLVHKGFRSFGVSVDENGNQKFDGVEIFDLDGQEISVWVELQSPKMVIYKGPDGKKNVGSSMRTYIQAPRMFDNRFEIKIRTSWLRPQDIQLHAVEAEYDIQKIAGGTRWTFSGKQQTISYYNSNWSAKMRKGANADNDSHRLDFLVHHLGKGGSYFDETCGDKGFTVESHNAPGAGMPFWDDATKSLNFSIESPHANSLGEPVVGYFRLWMPEAYLDCKWPKNSLSAAATIQVFVENEDGTYQTATTVVGRFKGMIRIEAHGFHYSAPTIKVLAGAKGATKALPAFTKNGLSVSKGQQSEIRKFLQKFKAKSLVCTSTYFQNSARVLASQQAEAICEYALSQRKGLKITTNVVQVSKVNLANKPTIATTR